MMLLGFSLIGGAIAISMGADQKNRAARLIDYSGTA